MSFYDNVYSGKCKFLACIIDIPEYNDNQMSKNWLRVVYFYLIIKYFLLNIIIMSNLIHSCDS